MKWANVKTTRIGREFQAVRYPVYKPDKLPWGFSYAEAERSMLKARKVWQPDCCLPEIIQIYFRDAETAVKAMFGSTIETEDLRFLIPGED